MTTIRFNGFPMNNGTLRFGAHHASVKQRLYARALAQYGDDSQFPEPIRLKTTAEKMGLAEKDARLLTQALDPKSSSGERKQAVGALNQSVFENSALSPKKAMHVLVAAHAIIREQQEKGEEVSLPKPFLKKLLKTAASFEHQRGREGLLNRHFPKQYAGPAFTPDMEQAYLKILLNTNQDDNIHDHESNFTRSVAQSSPENRKLALKEAAWMTPKLAMELLAEATPEVACQNERYPWSEETELATAQIIKRLEESYPKELGQYSLPQVGDVALDLLLELRQKQLPIISLHWDLLKLSLESPEFVLADGNRRGNGNNKERPYDVYLQGPAFPDQRMEKDYVRGLIHKARSFQFLAYLLDHAPKEEGASYDSYDPAEDISERVKELVDKVPPSPSTLEPLMISSLLSSSPQLQETQKKRALEAWAALDAAETEVPQELSEWLSERAVPIRQVAFEEVPKKKDLPTDA